MIGTDFDRATIAAFDAIAACPIPTLAAIEGYCIGGGLGLAAACDLRLARADSRFGIPAGKLGLLIRPMPRISWRDWSGCRKPSGLFSPPPI